MYSHLLILLIAKTALTYVRPLQPVCYHSDLAHWFSARHKATWFQVRLALALKFLLLFFFLFTVYFYCNMRLI